MGALKGFAVSIGEIILIIMIYFNIIDFLNVMPPEMDYFNKILSWIGLAVLIYGVSPTKIFFGKKHKFYDIVIIIAYFFLVMKNVTSWAQVSVEETTGSLRSLQELILAQSNFFEITSIVIGVSLLVILAVVFASTLEIYSPSTLDIIHESGKPSRNPLKFLLRFLSIFVVLVGFFVIVFNLLLEWLALAIGSPLVVIGIGGYFIFSIRFKSKFKASKFIYAMANFGNDFYNEFLYLFQSRKIYLGIIGMLIFHLLTDIGNFMIPYLTTIKNDMYFGLVRENHTPIITLFLQEIPKIGNSEVLGLTVSYIANSFLLLSLLVIPGFIWYKLSKKKPIEFNSIFLTMFYFSIPFFLLSPLFKFKTFNQAGLRGVDILSQEILKNTAYTLNSILVLASIVGLMVFWLTFTRFKPMLYITTFFLSCGFFGYYIYLYFTDMTAYFIETVSYLMSSSEYITGGFMVMLLLITILFYLGGFISYIFAVVLHKAE